MRAILKKYWGYQGFRPFQEQIVRTLLQQQDSLSILPTGAGKSLCFQVPALMMEGMTVVVSPLISLMKDQVDSLQQMGVAAGFLNSSLEPSEQAEVIRQVRTSQLKLLYLAPERLNTEAMLNLLQAIPPAFFVIDEAHCVSEWGHDFREDYRKINFLKEVFPKVSVHAFTATATQEVQRDIVNVLQLANPCVTVAPIDRPNLTYHVQPRTKPVKQITESLARHKNEPGIIYCLRRVDVDELSHQLNHLGYQNLPYHAGLSDQERHDHQEKFAKEEVDLIVATVAFGMGIDRSNIRFIIHSALPKSIEHFQQETGRAGRDGLPAQCYLFYSGADYRTWEFLNSKSPHRNALMAKLQKLYQFCINPQCRHRALMEYFGQQYTNHNCGACDYCLGEIEVVNDSLVYSQKILSCVYRVKESFGADHVARILQGKTNPNIERWGHHELSTFGLMKEEPLSFTRSLIEQLVGQNFLKRNLEYATLSLTDAGREALRGRAQPRLARPVVPAKQGQKLAQERRKKNLDEWDCVDPNMFEALRQKRRELAQAKDVPAFIIFGDKSLREMAAKKPTTVEAFAEIYGVGEQKSRAYAQVFIDVIRRYCN